MKEKLKTIKLTERQWDHVLIAMENAVVRDQHFVNAAIQNKTSHTGALRSIDRHDEIAKAIARQLDWNEPEGFASTWKMVARVAKTASDEDIQEHSDG